MDECLRFIARLLEGGEDRFPPPRARDLAGHRVRDLRAVPRSAASSRGAIRPLPADSHEPLGRDARVFDPISTLRNLEVATATPAISRLDLGSSLPMERHGPRSVGGSRDGL